MNGKTGGDRGLRHVRAGIGPAAARSPLAAAARRDKPGEHGQHGEREGRSR
jgi:hypothetical protein